MTSNVFTPKIAPSGNAIGATKAHTPTSEAVQKHNTATNTKIITGNKEPARKILTDVIYSVNLQKANRLYSQNPEEYVKFVKNINVKTTADLDNFSEIGFTQIDINSIIAEQAEGGVSSKFEWINNCFSCGAYEFGQLGLIAIWRSRLE